LSDPGKPPVLVVADPERIAELVAALSSLDTIGDVLVGAGGDDTLELAAAHHPPAVVMTAGLEAGDAGALIDALREQVRAEDSREIRD